MKLLCKGMGVAFGWTLKMEVMGYCPSPLVTLSMPAFTLVSRLSQCGQVAVERDQEMM